MNFRLRFFLLIWVPLFLPVFLSSIVHGQVSETAAGKPAEDLSEMNGPVELKGDNVSFNNQENKFEAQGNVIVTRGKTRIFADSMQFYRQEQIAIAQGNIIVEGLRGTIYGDKMTYNLQEQTGNFTNAYV
ncbi:MAG: LPS-assembly protein LptD, partial [Candidatus Omnitrophica bacterium]|nr:LPS-assembly protein LptD [Candidatus Omnitrophota bacterium]